MKLLKWHQDSNNTSLKIYFLVPLLTRYQQWQVLTGDKKNIDTFSPTPSI